VVLGEAGYRDEAVPVPPLELEHVIGYSGRKSHTLVAHPQSDAVYITGLGSSVVIADITDPHKQTFLKAHTCDISALAVSHSGSFIASGQVASPLSPVRGGRFVPACSPLHARVVL
jgi:hypothetical protein